MSLLSVQFLPLLNYCLNFLLIVSATVLICFGERMGALRCRRRGFIFLFAFVGCFHCRLIEICNNTRPPENPSRSRDVSFVLGLVVYFARGWSGVLGGGDYCLLMSLWRWRYLKST